MTADREPARTDFTDLVRSRMGELNIGSRTLAAACVDPEDPDAGPLWSRSTLDNLLNGRRIKPPEFPQLRALAVGLQIHISVVQEAAGSQFLGIDSVWSQDGKARALVIGFREMAPEDQAKVLALIEEKTPLRHT
ncbi:XRE family transcriptional regulator [Streptomyces stelliscabiei]|uniref:XRE family transcriptional regulator n=1 Tax=Streptomyces stelliscabiei TaxID=146820 RepID=UPI002FEF63C3